jgi:hypothetical protein
MAFLTENQIGFQTRLLARETVSLDVAGDYAITTLPKLPPPSAYSTAKVILQYIVVETLSEPTSVITASFGDSSGIPYTNWNSSGLIEANTVYLPVPSSGALVTSVGAQWGMAVGLISSPCDVTIAFFGYTI